MVANGGLGKHLYNVTYNEMELKIPVSQCYLNDQKSRHADVSKASAACSILNFFTIYSTKLSLICFNARLTELTSTFWKWTHRVFFVFVFVFGWFCILYDIFTTIPTAAKYSYIYVAHHPKYRSIIWHKFTIFYTSIHIATDWILLGIPVLLVWKLQMSLTRKLRCIIPISVGCLSCIGAAYSCWLQDHMPKDISCKLQTV